MGLTLRRCGIGLFFSALIGIVACADSRRGPTSPSAAPLPTETLRWECGRVSASTSAGDGWTFPPPDGCPPAAALPDVGIGLIDAAPSNLRSTVSATTVRLDWDAVPGAVAFLIEAGSAETLADLARLNTGSAAPSLVVNNVPTGSYFVRVRAIGGDGIPGPPSNEITVRVGLAGGCAAAPLPPTGFTVLVDGNRVALTWFAAVGGDPAASYIVEAGSAPTLRNLVVFDTGVPVTRLDAIAPNGVYYARMRGRNACGIGGPSNEVVVAVGMPAPQLPPTTGPPGSPSPQPPGGGGGGGETGGGGGGTGGGGTGGGGGTSCTYSVSPSEVFLTANDGDFSVRVTTAAGCAWSASASGGFVSGGGSSAGTGSASFSVSANPGPSTRQGSVRVSFTGGGQDVGVTQVAPQPAPPGGGPGIETTLTVTPQTGVTTEVIPTQPPEERSNAGACQNCVVGAATATNNSNGTVTLNLASSNGVPFDTVILTSNPPSAGGAPSYYLIEFSELTTAASLVVAVPAGQVFTAHVAFSQGAELPIAYVPVVIGTACSFTVPSAITVASSAGTFDVTVTTTAGCSWTASSLSPSFITVVNGSGTASGTARFSITANLLSTARPGTVRVAGKDVTVTQVARGANP